MSPRFTSLAQTFIPSSRWAQPMANMISCLSCLTGMADSVCLKGIYFSHKTAPQWPQVWDMAQPSIQLLKSRSLLWLLSSLPHIQLITVSSWFYHSRLSQLHPLLFTSKAIILLSATLLYLHDCNSPVAGIPPILFLPCTFSWILETSWKMHVIWWLPMASLENHESGQGTMWPLPYLMPLSFLWVPVTRDFFFLSKLPNSSVSGFSHMPYSLCSIRSQVVWKQNSKMTPRTPPCSVCTSWITTSSWMWAAPVNMGEVTPALITGTLIHWLWARPREINLNWPELFRWVLKREAWGQSDSPIDFEEVS